MVVGIGITPNTTVAERSGLAVDNGILVDEYCRTGVPNVYAAGDVANHWHPLFGERIRVEHFDNANRQGAAAANNMIGRTTPYDDPHWFWSDQYGHNLQYIGHAPTGTSWSCAARSRSATSRRSTCATAWYGRRSPSTAARTSSSPRN